MANRRRPAAQADYAREAAIQASEGRTIRGTGTSLDGRTPGGIDEANASRNWFDRNFVDSGRGVLGTMAALGGTGFMPGGAFNPAAASAAGGASALPGTSAGGMAGGASSLPGTSAGGFLAGGGAPAAGGGFGGFARGMAGKLDPNALLLGGLSMLGEDEPLFQQRDSFNGTGADPVAALTKSLDSIETLSSQIGERRAPLKSPTGMGGGPAPISIDGIPFQIGGGLGRNPAREQELASQPQQQTPSPSPGNPTPQRRRQ